MTVAELLALSGGGLPADALNAIARLQLLINFPPLVGLGLPGVAANVSNALPELRPVHPDLVLSLL